MFHNSNRSLAPALLAAAVPAPPRVRNSGRSVEPLFELADSPEEDDRLRSLPGLFARGSKRHYTRRGRNLKARKFKPYRTGNPFLGGAGSSTENTRVSSGIFLITRAVTWDLDLQPEIPTLGPASSVLNVASRKPAFSRIPLNASVGMDGGAFS